VLMSWAVLLARVDEAYAWDTIAHMTGFICTEELVHGEVSTCWSRIDSSTLVGCWQER